MANKTFNTRVKNKRDTAANWEAVATTFQPLDGELIIVDTAAGKTRFKVGRYDTAKGRLLYYNEIPFTDEYLYNDLNESQGKIYDKLKGIDDKSIIEMTLEPVSGNGATELYRIGLWQFSQSGFYKIKFSVPATSTILFQGFARETGEDGTTNEDFSTSQIKIYTGLGGDAQTPYLFALADYLDNDSFTSYHVQFLNLGKNLGKIYVNTYDKSTQKWSYVCNKAVKADSVANDLTITKGDTTTKFDGSTAQTVSIPTKTSELTNDSDFTTQTDLDNLTNTVVSYSAQKNITDEQKTQARTNIGAISSDELVQSDWNQNDETAKDYIKNRICYTEESITELGNTYEIWKELVNDGSTTAIVSIPLSIKYDGIIYKDIKPQYIDQHYHYVLDSSGNSRIIVPYTGTGSTGTIIAYPEKEWSFIKTEEVIHKIPSKYIDMSQADWNQNDETAKDYVKNRPGAYYTTIEDANISWSNLTSSDYNDLSSGLASGSDTAYEYSKTATINNSFSLKTNDTVIVEYSDTTGNYKFIASVVPFGGNIIKTQVNGQVLTASNNDKILVKFGSNAPIIVTGQEGSNNLSIVTNNTNITAIIVKKLNIVKIPEYFLDLPKNESFDLSKDNTTYNTGSINYYYKSKTGVVSNNYLGIGFLDSQEIRPQIRIAEDVMDLPEINIALYKPNSIVWERMNSSEPSKYHKLSISHDTTLNSEGIELEETLSDNVKSDVLVKGVKTPIDDNYAANKKYVDDNKSLMCTITGAGTDASPYVCDKTYDEILAAVENGQIPYILHPKTTSGGMGDKDIIYFYYSCVNIPTGSYILFRNLFLNGREDNKYKDIKIFWNNNITFDTPTLSIVNYINGKTGDVTLKTSDLENDSNYINTVDDALSTDSTNPVQNKVVKAAIDDLQASIDEQEPLIGTENTLTVDQVKTAILAGRPVVVSYTDTTYGEMKFTNFAYNTVQNVICSNMIVYYANTGYILAELVGTNQWGFKSTVIAEKSDLDAEIQAINNQLGGLTGAMHFIGKATVDITDGSTTDPQIANYTTKEKGDVILGKDDHKEFVWNGAIWEELGDEGSYALKTTTINGKALSDNITLTASDVGAASASAIETMQAAIDSKPSAADAVYTATAESTDGVAYTATVSGIDSLTVGASFIMIPNKASTSKAPTLNVNGLGAKPIRRRLSSLTTSLQQGYSTNWIALNKPFTVVYDGTAWVIEGLTKTDGADVYGAVAQATADANGNNIADTYATIAMLQSLLPKVTTITLTSNWVGDASPYYQDIALSCVTETSIVDLQPTPEQLNSWQDDGIAFTTLSGNGTVRVYVAGGKPSSAISVQVRVQEVTVI